MLEGRLQDNSVPEGAHEKVPVVLQLPVVLSEGPRRKVQGPQGSQKSVQNLLKVYDQEHQSSPPQEASNSASTQPG